MDVISENTPEDILMHSFSLIQRHVVQEADKVQHAIQKQQRASRITWSCMYQGCGAVYHCDTQKTFSGFGKLTVERPHTVIETPEISEPEVLCDVDGREVNLVHQRGTET
jgi:hypothetical protein